MLTAKQLEALTASDAGRRLSDAGGLFGKVRARRDGHITVAFTYRYRSDGAHRDIRCGTWPDTTLKQIRAERDRARAAVSSGTDPSLTRRVAKTDKAKEQAALRASTSPGVVLSVKDLFEHWDRLALSNRKDKGAEVRRCFQKDVLPKIGAHPAAELTRAMVVQLLDEVVERGARIVARNLLGDIRQMYGFAIVRGYVESDPTSHLKRDTFGKKVERDRVLSAPEITDLALRIPGAKLARGTELAIWVMLSTCCRIGELSQARWSDVDIDAGTWNIPPDNTKNAKTHVVALSEFSVEQFRLLQRVNGRVVDRNGVNKTSDWCFPGAYGESSIGAKTLSKQIRDRQRESTIKGRTQSVGTLRLSGGDWTPHDLRRTGATLMGSLGVRPDVIEKCLNHVEQNRMKRIYQRQELKAEQAEGWRMLGEHVTALIKASEGKTA